MQDRERQRGAQAESHRLVHSSVFEAVASKASVAAGARRRQDWHWLRLDHLQAAACAMGGSNRMAVLLLMLAAGDRPKQNCSKRSRIVAAGGCVRMALEASKAAPTRIPPPHPMAMGTAELSEKTLRTQSPMAGPSLAKVGQRLAGMQRVPGELRARVDRHHNSPVSAAKFCTETGEAPKFDRRQANRMGNHEQAQGPPEIDCLPLALGLRTPLQAPRNQRGETQRNAQRRSVQLNSANADGQCLKSKHSPRP